MSLGASADVKDQPASPQPSPHPDGERKINIRGIFPSNSWNDSTNGGGASMARPPKLARKVRPPAPKTQNPRRVCRHGSESHQISLAFILRKISWMNFFSPPKNRRSHGASRPSVLSFSSSGLIVQARSALRESRDWQCRPNQATDQARGQTCLS